MLPQDGCPELNKNNLNIAVCHTPGVSAVENILATEAASARPLVHEHPRTEARTVATCTRGNSNHQLNTRPRLPHPVSLSYPRFETKAKLKASIRASVRFSLNGVDSPIALVCQNLGPRTTI